MDYFASKGMNIFRIPFKWERLQPTLGQALDDTYSGQLDSIVTYATGKGVYIILDVHKYDRFDNLFIDPRTKHNFIATHDMVPQLLEQICQTKILPTCGPD